MASPTAATTATTAAAAVTIISAEPGSPKSHFSLDVKFPVYALTFVNDTIVILGGGGGSSRSGVKNRLSMYRIDSVKKEFDLIQEHELSREEDAPMSILVNTATKQVIAGINSSAEKMKTGVNENLRVFSYTDEGIQFERSKQTINSTNEDHYQKVTAFNRSKPSMIAIGSTNSQLSLFTYPALDEVFPSIEYDGEEVYDVDFDDSGEMLMGTSSNKLCIWSTTAKVLGGEPREPIQVIERPLLKKELACTFRAVKFGRKATAQNIFTVVNVTPAVRSRKAGKGEKKSFISMWDTKTWSLVKTRTVSQRPITAFDVSDDGSLLAFGSSDLSVGVLDALTLRSLMTILRAHDFPVTSLRFNPSASLVISGSADNSVRVITVPPVESRGNKRRPNPVRQPHKPQNMTTSPTKLAGHAQAIRIGGARRASHSSSSSGSPPKKSLSPSHGQACPAGPHNHETVAVGTDKEMVKEGEGEGERKKADGYPRPA